nr:MAG TPA: hypothetical protein [Caudoviricetes sp.]
MFNLNTGALWFLHRKTAPARTARASCCCRSPGCTVDNDVGYV